MKKTLKSNKGFTLIELIIVVIILGVLSGMGIPKLYQWVRDSRVNSTLQNVAMVQSVAQSLFLKTGTLDGGATGSTPTCATVTTNLEGALGNNKKLGDMGIWVNYVDAATFKIILGINWGSAALLLNGETQQPLNLNAKTDLTAKTGYWNDTVPATSNVFYNFTVN